MCWKPGWMSGDPCAGGNLPWKLEVLSQGRGLQGREWARLEKTSRERGLPGAARETSPSFLSSCVCSHPQPAAHCVLWTLGPVWTDASATGFSKSLSYRPDGWGSLASESRGAVSAEMLTLGRAQNRGHCAPPGTRGRCRLPHSSTCPPLALCLPLVVKWTLTCSDLCRTRHAFHFKNVRKAENPLLTAPGTLGGQLPALPPEETQAAAHRPAPGAGPPLLLGIVTLCFD